MILRRKLTAAQQITQIYVGYYNRAPDAAGLNYWVGRYNAGMSLSAIAQSFSVQDESTNTYAYLKSPNIASVSTFLTSVYANLFNRAPDASGLKYWSDEINAGRSNVGNAILNIISGASGAGANAADLTTLTNKMTAGLSWALSMANTPNAAYDANAAASAHSVIAGVTSDAATVKAATTAATSFFANGGGVAGDNFVLTSDIDTVNGTGGNDTITGVIDYSGATNVDKFGIGDAINGGAGTDTLKIVLKDVTGDVDLGVANISNVEKLVVVDSSNTLDSGGGNGEVNLGSDNAFSDVTLVNSNYAYVYNVNEASTSTLKASNANDYAGAEFYYSKTNAKSVSFTDNLVGVSGHENYSYAAFYHGQDYNSNATLTAATEISATLNLTNATVVSSNYDWADQYIYADNAGNDGAAITTTTNVVDATSDGTSNSGAYTYIYREANSVVTSNINVTNSNDVDVWIYANYGGASVDDAVDTANVVLSNVSNDSYTEVGGYDFEVVNITVNGKSSLDDLSFWESSDSPTSQTVKIFANADLTVGTSDYNDSGSVSVVISGSGNVDLGAYNGTGDTLSSDVTDKIDASALTGNFSVEVSNPIQSVKGGSGNDTIYVTDVSTFGDSDLGGLVLSGGAGVDTVGFNEADWSTIASGALKDRAKISGFETLAIHGALGSSDYDVSKISGIKSFTAAAGVANGDVASLLNLGAASTVTLSGDLGTNDGSVDGSLKTDTSADSLTLVLKANYTENNDSTATETSITSTVTFSEIENLTINAIGKPSEAFKAASGDKADYVTYTVSLTDDAIESLTVTGNQKVSFTSLSTQESLGSIDASSNTGGVTIDASSATADAVALKIKGSATAANDLTGTQNQDTIIGGAKADTITGGAAGDTLTGGAGNDTFVFAAGDSSLGSKVMDTITDFSANTKANADSNQANATESKWTGDVLEFSGAGTAADGVVLDIFDNATDAQTYLSQNTNTNGITAALDSSSGRLYVDNTADGTADFVIKLTGVKTLTEAAFVVV